MSQTSWPRRPGIMFAINRSVTALAAASAFLHATRRVSFPGPQYVRAALHVGLRVDEAPSGIDAQAVAGFDGRIRIVGFDDLSVAHDAQARQKRGDVQSNRLGLLAPPPVNVIRCCNARHNGGAAQAVLFPDGGPLHQLSIDAGSSGMRVARKSRRSNSAETSRATTSGPMASSR